MKAIVREEYGSPDVLTMAEIDKPVPAGDEVLVRVHAASLNTADLDFLRGRPRIARVGYGLRGPRRRVLGLDVAGRVEAVGESVTRHQVGDEVWADLFSSGHGGFAEYVCARESAFWPKPAGLTFEVAATVPHSAVLALQGLGRGKIQAGQKVLINGAGGCVGPFAVQIAKSFGAEVTAVDLQAKLSMLRSVGADHVIDYTREDFTQNGQRYDLILDIAGQRSVLDFRRSLNPRGTYRIVADSIAQFLQAMVVGSMISLVGTKRMGIFMWIPNQGKDLELLGRLLVNGEIEPHIDRRYELSEVPEALAYLEQGRARGKIVITP
jgi:NADPH:quinone reductase-like Zn-dependent oxidoreductase